MKPISGALDRDGAVFFYMSFSIHLSKNCNPDVHKENCYQVWYTPRLFQDRMIESSDMPQLSTRESVVLDHVSSNGIGTIDGMATTSSRRVQMCRLLFGIFNVHLSWREVFLLYGQC